MTEALGEPQWCRVSVVGGNTQVDLALPAAVPIASYIGELTGLVESRNPDRGEDDDAEATRLEHWSLARLGGSPFAPEQTLAALGVLDGDLLVLQKVSGSTVPALFDDVIDAVARLSADMFDSWGAAAARRTGLAVTAVAVGAAMALLVALKQQQGRVVLAGLVAAGFGVVAFAAALYAARSRADAASTVVFGLCAALLPAFGFAVALPDGLGSPHAMLACAVAAVLGVLVHRYTGVGAAAFSALVTLGLFGAGAAVARLASDAAGTKIGAGVVAVGLTFMTSVPRLAMVLARLPIPPVPTAGAEIDPHDSEPRQVVEGIGAIGAVAIPSAARLGERARRAGGYQTGIMAAFALATGAGSVAAAAPVSTGSWQGVALALVVAAVLGLRGRSVADVAQAGVLVVAAAATLLALLVGLAAGRSELLAPMALLLLGLAVAVALVGLAGSRLEVSPVTRRAGELFEYLLIITVIPLVFWIVDLYGMARDL